MYPADVKVATTLPAATEASLSTSNVEAIKLAKKLSQVEQELATHKKALEQANKDLNEKESQLTVIEIPHLETEATEETASNDISSSIANMPKHDNALVSTEGFTMPSFFSTPSTSNLAETQIESSSTLETSEISWIQDGDNDDADNSGSESDTDPFGLAPPSPQGRPPNTNENNRVVKLLESSLEGRLLLKEGRDKGLSTGSKRILANLVMKSFREKHPNQRVYARIFKRIVKEIVEVFPQDPAEIWYTPGKRTPGGPKTGVQARGKLFFAYHNQRKKLIKMGFVRKRR